jgi:hypothetical protein
MQLSKKCPFVIATNLNPASGNATWKIPNTVPYATYSLRALVYTNVTMNGKITPDPIATGVSVGYFQVSSCAGRRTAQNNVTSRARSYDFYACLDKMSVVVKAGTGVGVRRRSSLLSLPGFRQPTARSLVHQAIQHCKSVLQGQGQDWLLD